MSINLRPKLEKLRVPKVRELMTKQFANPIDKFLNLNIVQVLGAVTNILA